MLGACPVEPLVTEMRLPGKRLGFQPGEVQHNDDKTGSRSGRAWLGRASGGLRHADEAVRHKMLDALGDLALAGAPILGRYTGHRAGHALTNSLLRALFADPTAFKMVICDEETANQLPGAGVHWGEIPAVA